MADPRSSRAYVRALSLLLLSISLGAPAAAQVAVEQYEPAPLASDGFALGRPTLLKKHEWSAMLSVDYANDPLVYRITRGAGVKQRVISDHLVVHLGASLGLHPRVMLFTTLPVHTWMQGDPDLLVPNTEPDGAGLGDLALGARILLAGSDTSLFALATELIARLPTAELVQRDQRYSGDQVGSYDGALVGELRKGRFDARLRAGLRFRKAVQEQNLDLSQALLFGAGARLQLPRGVALHAELFGSTYLAQAFEQHHTPLELLFGPKYQRGRIWFGAAAGPGLVDGYGSPDVRILGSFGVAPDTSGKPAEPRATSAGSDRDHDGVLDATDRCPTAAEDRDGFEDADGCPDLDRDHDGAPDPTDQCPDRAEDPDGFQDADGCPDLDDDADGMEDAADRCPREEGSPDLQGCPPPVPAPNDLTVEFGHVEFGQARGVSLASSQPTLRAVESILKSHPELLRTRVEGHADDKGSDTYNLELSKRRARAVARWLIAQGIDPERLVLYACGRHYPLASEVPQPGDQRNRRVEFHVMDPAPATQVDRDACEPIPPR